MNTTPSYRVSSCLAVALLGLMAGFFFAFTIDVAPAMTHLDAATYITTQQWINQVVRNIPFAVAYFGSTAIALVPAAVALARGQRALALAWLALGLVYFGAVFWVTRSINIPINNAVAQWNPLAPPADWALLRDRWNEANLWRAVASAGCFFAAIVLATATPARREAAA